MPADVLALAMSPPHFPIGPDGLRGDWTFESVKPGSHAIEGFEVVAFDVPHKGGRTFGYPRSADGHVVDRVHPRSLPAGRHDARDRARVRRASTCCVHDAQFLEHERAVADLYGHATVDDAIELARRCGAGRLALFHHSPGRTDDEVDAIGTRRDRDRADVGVEVFVAREEDVIDLRRLTIEPVGGHAP